MRCHIFPVKNCLVAHVLASRILDPCTQMERLLEGLLQRLTFSKQQYVGFVNPFRFEHKFSQPFRSLLIQLLVIRLARSPNLVSLL
jgi:hypothetical protein